MTAAEILLDELRHARTSRGMNQDEFGRLINYSGTHVSAVETGTRPPTAPYMAAVDNGLKTGGIFVRLLERLSDLDAEPVWLREWITYEQQARMLRWYELAWVPGLLQTEAYARAVFGNDGRLSATEVETRVAARLARQKILYSDDPPRLVAVLDESILRRPVGGSAVMREQLHQLATLNAERRRVRIHVVPAAVGAYAGLDGPFVIATMPGGEEVVYLDNRLLGQAVDRAADVADVRGHWEATLAEALTLQQSTELILEVAKSWI
jgi:transcriptional regulator with XRE-family HTH domain